MRNAKQARFQTKDGPTTISVARVSNVTRNGEGSCVHMDNGSVVYVDEPVGRVRAKLGMRETK